MPLTSLLWFLLACQSPEQIVASQQDRCATGADIEACFQLGLQAYNKSIPDIGAARGYFSKACNVHHPRACFMLADMVDNARGGPRDPKRAAELYEIACKGKLREGCVGRAKALYAGDGVDADPQAAVELFKEACGEEPVEPRACTALGRAYAEGKGVEAVDLDVAERLHRRACELKYPPGCTAVGGLYRLGGATPEEEKERRGIAVDFFNEACRLDANHGCYELGEMHRDAQAPDPSDVKATLFFQKVCTVDGTRGCFEAAQIMESGRVKARDAEIESLYNRACEHGHTAACSKRSLRKPG